MILRHSDFEFEQVMAFEFSPLSYFQYNLRSVSAIFSYFTVSKLSDATAMWFNCKYSASVILVENPLAGDLLVKTLIRVIEEEGTMASAEIALVCTSKVRVGC